jgi:DNA (cytosine-5)-methyltransferase 1
LRVLDLFSGIGGFSLGLERAGMETVAFCEYDKKAQLVLKKHWPEIPIYDDIRTLTGKQIAEEIGAIDLICGGFPCQGFSVAGNRRGVEDDRYLWPEYFRLIKEVGPRIVIGENVPGIIDLALDQVLSDLESADYSCQTFIIPACAVNAPHRRDRVWIVAYSGCGGRWDERPFEKRGRSKTERSQNSNSLRGSGRKPAPLADTYAAGQPQPQRVVSNKRGRIGHRSEDVSNSNCQGQQNVQGGGENAKFPGIGTFSGSDWWDIEPSVGRVAHGVSGRVDRLKQLGNAVVPQIPEIIGRAIMEIEGSDKR